MHRIDPDPALRPEGEITLTTISSRSELPRRVRMLLEDILGLTGGLLERTMSRGLTEYEQQLFKLAEKSQSNDGQHGLFETLREVKRGRAEINPRVMFYLESALARLDEGYQPEVASTARRYRDMALVETCYMDEDIVLREMATKAEFRHSQALSALGYRFGVLAGSPAFDSDRLPIGPRQLCQAIRHGSNCLGIPLEHRLLLYRQFDSTFMTELGVLYSSINEYLVGKRILRFLHDVVPRLRSTRFGVSATVDPDAPVATKPVETGAGTAPPTAAATVDPRAAGAGTSAPAAPGRLESASGQGPRLNELTAAPSTGAAPPIPMTDFPAVADPAAMSLAQDQREDARDSELFHTLRDLLGGRRYGSGASPTPAAGIESAYTASNEDLQSVLGLLQGRPVTPVIVGGHLVQRSVAHLKQDLLTQLRRLAPDGRPPRLAEEDSDTVDLVGMLFDFIVQDTGSNAATQDLLTKLQVPVLRVALRDKSFFTRRNHPARQLLNAIAETGKHWIDDSDGDKDRVLVEKMQLLVDHVTSEYNGKVELFDEMLGDLSRHMGTLARKAEVAERRHVDAAKGRERLDVAREQALKAINDRLLNRSPNRLVRTLLEQAWVDVLALTLLRQGENSASYRRCLSVADQLIENNGSSSLAAVRVDLEQGLSQVGFHAEEVQAMVHNLIAPEEAAKLDNPASRTELALKLKNKTHLGVEIAGSPAADAAARARPRALSPPLNAEELKALERLKTLAFGTLIDFTTNQQGDTMRRKLSWFSTLTGRCLFVNQRGARADDRSMEQLARDLVRGEARIVSADKESLIDRGWRAIEMKLKHLSGSAPAPGR